MCSIVSLLLLTTLSYCPTHVSNIKLYVYLAYVSYHGMYVRIVVDHRDSDILNVLQTYKKRIQFRLLSDYKICICDIWISEKVHNLTKVKPME